MTTKKLGDLLSALFGWRLRGSSPRNDDLVHDRWPAVLIQARTKLGIDPQLFQSQLGQDLFAWAASGKKVGGYFVEFGAADGKALSNTYLLEKAFGWHGILCEPSPQFLEISKHRTALADNRCVWRRSGETLEFSIARRSEYSTLRSHVAVDAHAGMRRKSTSQWIQTVSLIDLLRDHSAPPVIDFISVDTEGSEFEILEAFDFSAYDVRSLTIEHNGGESRAKIHDLMVHNGFVQAFSGYTAWDDWYVSPESAELLAESGIE